MYNKLQFSFQSEWVNTSIYLLLLLFDSNVEICNEFFITFLMHKEIKFLKQTPLDMKHCERASLSLERDMRFLLKISTSILYNFFLQHLYADPNVDIF